MSFQAVPHPQPGAMTAAMRAHAKLAVELRVAVVREGRIVDERRVARTEAVTVGGERATVVTGGRSRTLIAGGARGETGFALVGGGIAGRIQQSGAAQDVAQLPDGAELPLAIGARGRLVVDGTTLLFDFVPARSRTRPALPAAVKKGLFGDVDWPFTSWVTAAMVGCFALVAIGEASDPTIEMDVSAQLSEVAHFVVEPPTPPPTAALATNDTSDTAPTTPDTSHATPSNSHGDTHRPSPNRNPRPSLTPEQVQQLAQDQAQILLVTALGANDSAMRDLMRNGAPTISQRDVMDQVHGAVIATNDQILRTRPGDSGSGEDHDLGHLAQHIATQQANEGPGPTEQIVHVVVHVDPPDFGPGFPEPSSVLSDRVVRAVRGRLPMIRACYEHHLINAPTTSGKVVETFTVERAGVLSHVETDSNTADAETARCVHDGLATLRIHMEEGDEPADFAFPFVFAPRQ